MPITRPALRFQTRPTGDRPGLASDNPAGGMPHGGGLDPVSSAAWLAWKLMANRASGGGSEEEEPDKPADRNTGLSTGDLISLGIGGAGALVNAFRGGGDSWEREYEVLDTRLPPTIVDIFSQLGITGDDRTQLNQRLAPVVLAQLLNLAGYRPGGGNA